MQADDDGELVVRFTGGYGFGKWWEQDGIRVFQVRTYLNEKGRDSLNKRQRQLVEKLNAYAVLFEGGMYDPDVIRDTALSASIARNPDILEQVGDKLSPETLQQIKDNTTTQEEYLRSTVRRLEAIKTLGLDREVCFSAMLAMSFAGLMERMLNMELNEPQRAIVASHVGMESADMVSKYARRDMSAATDAEQREFMDDFCRMAARTARRMKLRSMTEERIREAMETINKETVN
jgi:hypothetical protein